MRLILPSAFEMSLVTGLRTESYDPAGLGCYKSSGGFEMGKDAGDEHGGIKRFDDIIGGAKFKTARPVSLAQTSGNKNDRYVA